MFLSWREDSVGFDGLDDGWGIPTILNESGFAVESFGRDLESPREALENLGGGVADSPFDLAEIGVGNSSSLSQPSEGQVRPLSLLLDEPSNFT